MKLSRALQSGAGTGRKALLRLSLFALALGSLTAVHSPPSVNAAVPGKFTYQGNLRQGGFLVNGNRYMVFRVYSSSFAAFGTHLWASAETAVAVSTGVFRAVIEPVVADWDTGSLWLELQVKDTPASPAVILSPREELTSAPYAVNSLLIGGKRYTSAPTASPPNPGSERAGDLWMDTTAGALKYWTGAAWVLSSGGGMPATHAAEHDLGGLDPIQNLGPVTVTGAVTFDGSGQLNASGSVPAVTITTHAVVQGILNPASNLSVGGAGYAVTFASSVFAGTFGGGGAALTNLNAANLALGTIDPNRFADLSISRTRLAQSGCAVGEVLKWDASGAWICSVDSIGGGGETDPLSIHIQSTLQSDTTFYVSSGTLNYLTVNNRLDSFGPTFLRGLSTEQGLTVNAFGNIGMGSSGSADSRVEIVGADTDSYSFTVATGSVHQLVVATSGNVGVGVENPAARLEVSGAAGSGSYVAIFNSGPDRVAWLRRK